MLDTLMTMAIHARQATEDVKPSPYDHTENNAPKLRSTTSALFGVALALVMLRGYVRVTMTKTIGMDDWVMLVSMLGCVVVYVCMMREIHYGIGRHLDDPVIAENFSQITFFSFIRAIFLVFSISGTKISVGFFLLRVVDGTKYRRYIQGMIAFLIVFTLACIGTVVFQCIPVKAAWNFSLRKNAKCYTDDTFLKIALFNGAINIITDFFFAVLPIPVVWSLNVNLATKLSLIGILSLGFLAFAAAIVKEVLLSTFFKTPDFSYVNRYAIWNFVELTVGIYAACLPALRPLFGFIFDKASSTFNSRGATGLNKTSHKYYMQSNDINLSSVPNDRNNSDRYGVTITTQSRAAPKSKLQNTLADDSSEEYILQETRESACEKGMVIMVKTDVNVTQGVSSRSLGAQQQQQQQQAKQ